MGTNINVHGVAKVADNEDLEALLLVGAGNAKWIPLAFAGCYNQVTVGNKSFGHSGTMWQNIVAENSNIQFTLAKSLTLGALNLYVKAVRFGLFAANGTNYVTDFMAVKVNETTETVIDSDVTDRTAQGEYTLTFSSAESLVGFNSFIASLNCVLGTVDALQISHVEADCYYA